MSKSFKIKYSFFKFLQFHESLTSFVILIGIDTHILGRLACTLEGVLLLQSRSSVRGSMEHVSSFYEEKD